MIRAWAPAHRLEELLGGEIELQVDVVAGGAEPLEAAVGDLLGDQDPRHGRRVWCASGETRQPVAADRHEPERPRPRPWLLCGRTPDPTRRLPCTSDPFASHPRCSPSGCSTAACGDDDDTSSDDTTTTAPRRRRRHRRRRASEAQLDLDDVCQEAKDAGVEAPDGFTVRLVTDIGKIDDGTFNQYAYEGMTAAEECFGFETSYIETASEADYEKNINTALEGDPDVIITTGLPHHRRHEGGRRGEP